MRQFGKRNRLAIFLRIDGLFLGRGGVLRFMAVICASQSKYFYERAKKMIDRKEYIDYKTNNKSKGQQQ